MKIALVDPSLFTIPYDEALADALAAQGGKPCLYGRRLRGGEARFGSVPLEAFFYRLAERAHGRLPSPLLRLAKGTEHAVDMLRLRRVLARARPDIIHFQWAPLPVIDRRLIPSFRALAPTLLTVHDPTPFNGSARGALQAVDARAVYAAFDHLIVHTAAGKAHLRAGGIAESRISIIPHGPLATGAPAAAPRRPADAPVSILLFGKIKPYKGLDLLIEAFAGLPAGLRERARLRVVGEPYMELAPVQARAAALGIAGQVDWELRYVADAEIPAVLAAADILAFPYRQIDASGVLMMALRHGKPVLASALGAFADLLRDGVHGRLVPPEDVGALRAALAFLLEDPARAAAMGEKVRALADDIPGWGEIAETTLALYRRLVAERAASADPVRGERELPSYASPRLRGEGGAREAGG